MEFKNLKNFTHGLRQLSIKKDLNFEQLLLDIKKSKVTKKKIKLYFLCCPDYSFKVNNSGWGMYTYTDLGYGPGMMVFTYSKAFLEIVEIIQKEKVVADIIYAFADSETYDNHIVKRLRISSSEFRNRLRCSMSSIQFYTQNLLDEYSLTNKNFKVYALGMYNSFYKKGIISLAKNKLREIKNKDIEKVTTKRTKIIENLYGLDYKKNKQLFLKKIKKQILDRIIVGTKMSQERKRGGLVSIVTVTHPALLFYFNFQNKPRVPVLTLGG